MVFIYGYIREKDIFEHEYQKYLSQRLLEGTSRSEHTEKALIGKLKVEVMAAVAYLCDSELSASRANRPVMLG